SHFELPLVHTSECTPWCTLWRRILKELSGARWRGFVLKAACNKGSSGSLWKFVIFTLADTASAIRFLESPALRGFRVSGPGPGHWTTRHRFRKLLNPFRNWGYDNRNARSRHKASVPGACAG